MSRVFKAKQGWRTTPVPEDGPEQLSLVQVPTARSARAELLESEAGKAGAKKKRMPNQAYLSWPKDKEEVLVHLGEDVWLSGYMDGWHIEARDGGEFGGQKVIDQVKVHDVRLQPEKAQGLSESLRVSLPRYARVERLDQLRRP